MLLTGNDTFKPYQPAPKKSMYDQLVMHTAIVHLQVDRVREIAHTFDISFAGQSNESVLKFCHLARIDLTTQPRNKNPNLKIGCVFAILNGGIYIVGAKTYTLRLRVVKMGFINQVRDFFGVKLKPTIFTYTGSVHESADSGVSVYQAALRKAAEKNMFVIGFDGVNSCEVS